MKKSYYIYLFIALFSCGERHDYTTEVKVLGSELEKVKELEKDLNQIDSSKVVKMHFDYLRVIKIFRTKYTSDTIDDANLGRRMNLYKGLKHTKGFPFQKVRFNKEIVNTTNQLENLIHDLEQDVINPDSVKVYIDMELKASKFLISELQSYTEYINNQINIYDSLNHKLQTFVDSLIRENENF